MDRIISLLFTIVAMLLFSCSGNNNNHKVVNAEKKLKDPLIEANKRSARTESDQIDKFVKRRKWDVKKTGTGLRYMIYKEGEGRLARNGDVAVVDFTVNLLNGKECYSTEESEPKRFVVGKDHVESGLHEGVQYMHVGDKARLIIPSHLAHGLLGDLNKIPPKSTVIYDIELLDLE